MAKIFQVYILASESRVLYVGVTSGLARRVWQHRKGTSPGFTRKYNVKKLVWFELHGTAKSAIFREKEIKGWSRMKKIALFEAGNPRWEDLSDQLRP
jgi:putative endonuclease